MVVVALTGTLATIVGGVCLVLGVSAVAHDLSQPLRDRAQSRLDVGWVDEHPAGLGSLSDGAPVRALIVGDGGLLGLDDCLPPDTASVGALSADQAVRELARRGWVVPAGAGGAPPASMPRRVIVHVGTSQGLTRGEALELVAALGDQTRLLWSTIQLPDDSRRFPYENSTNAVVRSVARELDHVRLLDWNRLTTRHPEFLRADGLRVSNAGCLAYRSGAGLR